MSNTTTPATSDEALRAENEALKAQLAEIDKALGEWRGNSALEKAQAMQRHAQLQAQAYGRFIIGMQACIIDCAKSYEDDTLPSYMDWLVNTLAGPGLMPDMDEANELGGAQAFADKAHADLDAHYAKYPIPEDKELEDLRAELARWADPHQHWFVQQRDGTVYLPLGTGTCSDMVAPKEGWVIEAPVLELLTSLDSHIRQQDQAVDKMLDEAAKVGAALNGMALALTNIQTTPAARTCRAATKEVPAEVPLPPCDMGELCIGCQPRCSPPIAEDTPLETGEADARELPPEVVAKFVTTL